MLDQVAPRAGVLKERKSVIFKRADKDWYVEPTYCTEMLLTVERFMGPILDPSCGGGNIVKALLAAGYEAAGTDVEPRAGWPSWFGGKIDFLKDDLTAAPNIVMNPPYFKAKGAEAFIRKALSLATGKVCVFVDTKFLSAAGRAKGLFREHPPTRVWHISPRPSCPPGEFLAAGGKAKGGQPDYAWLVWDLLSPTKTTELGWLTSSRRDTSGKVPFTIPI